MIKTHEESLPALAYAQALDRLTQALVPNLADWYLLDLRSPFVEHTRQVEVAGAEVNDTLIKAWIERNNPTANPGPHPLADCVRSGRSALVSPASKNDLAALATDDESRLLVQRLGITSYICVPLEGLDGLFGIAWLVFANGDRHHTADDLSSAEAILGVAALTFDAVRAMVADQQAAQKAVQQAATRAARFQEITDALATAIVPADIANIINEQSLSIIGARGGSLVLLNERGDRLETVRSHGYSATQVAGYGSFSFSPPTPIGDAVRTGSIVVVESLEEWQRRYPHIFDAYREALSPTVATVPLQIKSSVVGAIGLSFAEPRTFSDEDIFLLRTLAFQCAQAIERAQLYEAERLARLVAETVQRRQARLADALRVFADASLDLSEVVYRVMRQIAEMLGDGCVVRLLADDQQNFAPGVAYHPDPASEAALFTAFARPAQAMGEGLTGRVVASVQPFFAATLTDNQRNALGLAPYRQLIDELQLHSLMILPLAVQGRVLGYIMLVRNVTLVSYNENDLLLLFELVDHIALAISNAQLYAAAQQARAEAEAAVRLRDSFFSTASHELKTPLTSLLGQAQLFLRRLRRAPTPDDQLIQRAQIVVTQAERLDRLITALLDFSRIEQGRLSIERVPLDMQNLIQQVIQETQPTLSRHILVYEELTEPLPIEGDPLRLEQVLHNLLSNAVKYSPDGGTITVRAGQQGDTAVVSISDAGIGIPDEAQSSLFTEFYRAPNADTRRISGMGIGLFVVKEIITLHGGSVTVESSEGAGSTFTITLPILNANR